MDVSHAGETYFHLGQRGRVRGESEPRRQAVLPDMPAWDAFDSTLQN